MGLKILQNHGSDSLAHHGANFAAVFIPLSALWSHVEDIGAGALLVAGLAWYGVLFYDRFIAKRRD